jgi:hypothetical protein
MSKNFTVFIAIIALLFLFSCQAGIDTGIEQPKDAKINVETGIAKALTKTISVSVYKDYTAPIDKGYYLENYITIPPTYNYDDGQFKGTLNCVSYFTGLLRSFYEIGRFRAIMIYEGSVTSYK